MATLLRLYRWLVEQPLRDRESLTKLARRGWFLSPHMSVAAIPQLGSAAEGMPNEVDLVVGQYFRQHLDNIEAALIESYPHRAHLFREAFGAHRECKYSLSIGAFLQQADGIFYERFEQLFFKKGRREVVNTFASEVQGRFFQAVLYPLTANMPLWADTRSLDDTFEGLNRHQVMHGMTENYNTELSSLKAISLLENLLWVLNRPAE